MREMLEMLLGEARGMWRFRWWGMALAWVLCLGGLVYVYSLPDMYRAESRVSVDTQSMLAPLLQGLAVSPDVDQRVEMMINTLLSQPNLERIARRTDLMLRADTPAEQEALLNGLRRAIRVSGSGRKDIYHISYSDESPKQAKAVVQATLDILMEETLGASRQDATTAKAFLKKQVNQYEQRLEEAEQRLAAFKRKNSGLLPSQEGGYYQRLNQAQQTLASLKEKRDIAVSRRQTVQGQIQAMRSGNAPSSAANPRVQVLDSQIQTSVQQLNDMLLKYTDSHPDVIALRERIKRLREQRKKAAESGGQVSVDSNITANPVFQQLQISLNDTNAEISALGPKIKRQRARIDELKSKVDQMTEVEKRLSSLNRDYTVTKQQYQELLTRLNTADISNEAGESGGGVNFRVIDPPTKPLEPAGPDRLLYLAVALAFGLGMGGALTLFLSKSKPVFLDPHTLNELTGRPVLGMVSLVRTQARQRAERVALAGFMAAAAMLVVVAGLGVLFADTGAHVLHGWLEGMAL